MAKSLETARNKEAHLAGLSDEEFMREWQVVADRALKDRELLVMYNQENQDRERLKALKVEPGDERLLQRAVASGIPSEERVMTGSDD